MKNLRGSKKGNFEKAWQDAFEGKEMTPSPDVWMKVDNHLANQESRKYRKGIFFYKWMAAASLFIATAITMFYVFNFNAPPSGETAHQNDINTEITLNEDNLKKTNDLSADSESGKMVIEKNAAVSDNNKTKTVSANEEKQPLAQIIENKDNNSNTDIGNKPEGQISENGYDEQIAANLQTNKDSKSHNNNQSSQIRQQTGTIANVTGSDKNTILQNNGKQETGVFNANKQVALTGTLSNDHKAGKFDEVSEIHGFGAEIVTQIENNSPDYLQKVVVYTDDPFKENKENPYEDDLWAGVDFSSGYFNPNFGSTRSQSVESNSFALSFEDAGVSGLNNRSVFQESSGGQSFSFGFNLGKRVAKRWVLQSGINYLNYATNGETNTFYELDGQQKTPAIADYKVANAETLNFASSVIDYKNQFEFLSVPLKAGYVVIDKKFSLVVSAGVGTDLLLKNRISPESEGLVDFTIKPGDDAPFRTIYFNGLLGTQLKYRFSEQYSLTLEPSYSLAINSFSKSDNNINSYPNVFNLGIGLKYHFK